MGYCVRWVWPVARRNYLINPLSLYPVLLSMERAIQETADYCRQRKAFGKSILDHQVAPITTIVMTTPGSPYHDSSHDNTR